MADKPSSPHLFAAVLARVHAVCAALASEGNWPAGIDFSRVVVEPPRDAAHGDMATNAAMVLAKEAKAKPRELADRIAEKLRVDDLITAVDVAGPGFINLTLKSSAWAEELRAVLREGEAYGKSATGASEKVNVVFVSERSLLETGNNKVAETIDFLRAKGDIYEGRLPPPKGGAPVEDYEDRVQLLFRATAYGDDVDRPLIKSDGSYTYFASDIANHRDKFERGFGNLIDVFGADHGGYIKRTQAAVKAVTGGRATLDVKILQLVRLLRTGEPVKMSKRSGDFVTLREVVEEVGSDAVRFMMLFRKNDAVLDFD